MNKILIILLLWGAGCTQQREELSGDYTYTEVEKFGPAKHYIVSIDTVGVHWGRGFIGMDTTLWKDWGGLFNPEDSLEVLFIDPIYGMTAIYELDTVFLPLMPPLFTPEELKKIRDILAESAP